MSTTFHPQTDIHTERRSQEIETNLQSYYNYEQNDWVSMLALAEYPNNNYKNSVMKISLFYVNYGF